MRLVGAAILCLNDRFVTWRESLNPDHKEPFSLNLRPIIPMSCL